MRKGIVILSIVLPALIALGIGWLCIYRFRNYGQILFLGSPIVIGFLASALLRLDGRRSFKACACVGTLSGVLLSFGFLVVGWEGIICIVMAVPLALPLILFGAWAGHAAFHKMKARPAIATMMLILVIAGLAVADLTRHAVAPNFVRSDSLVVKSSSDDVWRAVLATETLPPPDDWVLKTGLACPRRARVVRAGVGGERVCTLSTGEYVEAIQVWEPGRRLRWTATSTPPPLEELNPFHEEVDAPHLEGYYQATAGEIAIEQLGATSVLVTRRTWYRHNLYPAEYWRVWSDFAASRVHKFVLRELKSVAERGAAARVSSREGISR